MVHTLQNPRGEVTIAIVGKYVDLTESYKSLNEALTHGGISNTTQVNLKFVDSTTLTEGNLKENLDTDGILVPGGFGARGIEGKILAVRYARENKIPFFGICLGMHMAVIEYARNVVGMEDANSAEFNDLTPYPVIYLMTEWFDEQTQQIEKRDDTSDKGGTMRLGAYPCILKDETFAMGAYRHKEISERHRHRYEFNNEYKEKLEAAGLVISGTSPDGQLVEIVELKDHPWFLGCQFHPEFKSRPSNPHPLFREFIKASIKYAKNR